MSEPFLGEIGIVGFNFAPRGWAQCDGQILPINQNQSLFSLLGTTYGGDGRTTFALPDLRGRTPIHVGNGHTQGESAGEETSAQNPAEMPTHTHSLHAVDANANQPSPSDNLLAIPPGAVGSIYSDTGATLDQNLDSSTIGNTGSGQGHENMQPFLALKFIIALQGLFPSRN